MHTTPPPVLIKRALFLDRDGILNQVVRRGSVISSPRTPQEWVPVEEAANLVQQARQKNYLVLVVTNQPDIERQKMTQETLDGFHQDLRERLPLDAIFCCTASEDSDPRRKPNPGMLLEAAKEFQLDLNRCYFVGDSWKDVAAGKACGVHTVLLRTDYNQAVRDADFYVDHLDNVLEILESETIE
jgi:D-glycero-D-manno-heptose 1,7-bisphosphate phosphatase